jgi:hypothetical protein
MKDKLEHEAELAADEDAHKTEMEAKEKDYEAIEAAKEAANARKAAEQADDLSKWEAMLKA